jgi:Mg-chelatase subunit ChlD
MSCTFLHPTAVSGKREVSVFGGGGGGGSGGGGSPLSLFASDQSGIMAVSRKAGGGKGARHLAVASDGEGRTEVLSIEEYKRPMVFHLVLDVSGSMAGAPINVAIKGARAIHAIMRSSDKFGLAVFGDSSKVLHHPMPAAEVDWSRDERTIRDTVGGRTALYDAVVEGVAELKDCSRRSRGSDQLYEMLLITDGSDNSSAASLADAVGAVAKPGLGNFNLVLIGVGIDCVTAADMRTLCQPRHAKFIRVDNIHELAAKLTDVANRVKIHLHQTSPRGCSQASANVRRSKAPAAIQAALGQTELLGRHAAALMGGRTLGGGASYLATGGRGGGGGGGNGGGGGGVAAKRRGKPSGAHHEKRCYVCDKSGHIAAKCWGRSPASG